MNVFQEPGGGTIKTTGLNHPTCRPVAPEPGQILPTAARLQFPLGYMFSLLSYPQEAPTAFSYPFLTSQAKATRGGEGRKVSEMWERHWGEFFHKKKKKMDRDTLQASVPWRGHHPAWHTGTTGSWRNL